MKSIDIKEVSNAISKDLYINKQHHDNPFVQDDSKFYVRLLEIRDGWIAYQTCTNSVKYSKYEEFFTVFTRPETIYGKVLRTFANTPKYLEGSKDFEVKCVIKDFPEMKPYKSSFYPLKYY